MRILTFLHSFEPGGVERVALRLVRHWRDSGIDAPLFMGRSDGPLRAELAQSLSYESPPAPAMPVGWCETLWMIATLPAVIRRLRPDALFCAGNSYAVVAVAMKLVLGSRCPPVLMKISNDLERADMPWIARLFYRLWLLVQGRCIDRFVAMAPGLEREVARLIRPRPGAIAMIASPALSRERIERLHHAAACPAPGDGRRFVAIGRLARQKNLPLMLRAFALGARAGDRLLIVGDGPERAALQRLARRFGIADRVIFTGHVPDGAMLLRRRDTLILASRYEGVPGVVLEALAAGISVIATDCSAAMRPLLDHGRLGSVVASGDLDALSQEIGRLRPCADREAARARACRFAIEDAAPAYLTLFAEMTASSTAPVRTPLHTLSLPSLS
jgi:glycosyltransferase involved in cell wall biosynthesis